MRKIKRQSRQKELSLVPTNLLINREPIAGQPSVNRESTVSQPSANRESTVSQPSVQPSVNRESTVSQPSVNDALRLPSLDVEKLTKSLLLLTGKKRKFVEFIFNKCIEIGSLETSPISNEDILLAFDYPIRAIRTIIYELKKSGIFKVKTLKSGRVGIRIFILPKQIYQHLNKKHKPSVNRELTVSQPSVQPSVLASSSSSSILNTNTTTKKLEIWTQEIQTPENIKKIGIGLNHIKQLNSKFGLSPKEIQLGLEAFSYDLENGEKERLKARGIQNLIGYFFGAMKSGGYNSVKENFISAEDLAEQEMLERLELKKKEREERKLRLQELLFLEWIEGKSKEELCEISKPMLNYLDEFHKGSLKNYFIKNEEKEFKKGV